MPDEDDFTLRQADRIPWRPSRHSGRNRPHQVPTRAAADAEGGMASRLDGSTRRSGRFCDADGGILAIVSLSFPRSAVPRALLFCLSAVLSPGLTSAGEHRSYAAKREFQQTHSCPSAGRTSGACPGYVKDHIVPPGSGWSRPSPTSNGRQSRPRELRTSGSGGVALDSSARVEFFRAARLRQRLAEAAGANALVEPAT